MRSAMALNGLFLTLCLILSPAPVLADYLEVRRDTNAYSRPSKKSEVVSSIRLKEGEGPYVAKLLQDSKVNGYYKVRPRGKAAEGDGVVEFKGSKECEVKGGTWVAPYTGETFHDAKPMDVDHVVPLKNAHESGAWAWSREKREQYANYLLYERHLLAVKASENRKKGDKGPDRYLPPDEAFRCEYVKNWAKIKEDWELEMTDTEAETVQKVLDECP